MSAIRSSAEWTRFAASLYQGVSTGDFFLNLTIKLERGVGIGMVQWTSIDRASARPLDNCWSTPCDPKIIHDYTNHIQPIDPRIEANIRHYGQFLPCWQIVDPHTFDRSPIVGEWLDRKDVDRRWGVACIWNVDQDYAGLLAFLRPRTKGPVQLEEISIPKRLRSHIRRAAQLHFMFKESPARGRVFDRIWGSSSQAVFVMGRGRRLLSANSAGHDLLTIGDVFQTRWGELTAREPRLLAALDNALSAAVRFDLAIHPKPIVLGWPRRNGRTIARIEVMALPGIAAETGVPDQALALVFCRDAPRQSAY